MNRLSPDNHGSALPGHFRYRGGAAVLMMIVAFFLWTEHRAHVLGVLPYLIILACPLIHLLMHRGHGGHGGHHES